MKKCSLLFALAFVITIALSATNVKAATKEMKIDKNSKTEVVTKYIADNMDVEISEENETYILSYDDNDMEEFKASEKSAVLKELNKSFKNISSKDNLHYSMTAREESSSINKAAFKKMVVLSYLTGSDETSIEVKVKVGKKNVTYCLLLVNEKDM